MFTHLHTRSWFSFRNGGSSPQALARRAAELGMTALALTDVNGVYGAIRFQQACADVGIKPIIGGQVSIQSPESTGFAAERPLVLICRNAKGYENLNRILTGAHQASRLNPLVTVEQVAKFSEHLFCITGGRQSYLHSLLSERGATRDAGNWLSRLKEIFGDSLYAEITSHFYPHDAHYNQRLYDLAKSLGIPSVVTGDVCYATPNEYAIYDLLRCVDLGINVFHPHPSRPANGQAYIRSEAELCKIIRLDIPDAYENSNTIAEQCEVDLLPGYVTPPTASIPDGHTPSSYISEICVKSLDSRFTPERSEAARAQLKKELAVIGELEIEEFFLVVREIVAKAREMGIRCLGRGSAANSLVAYLLDITGVDPLEHGLLFERFLHSGRRGMPDIDVDFDSEKREQVIAWMEQRFGIEHTCMTANVVTYGLRSAIRDTAKALGWPLPVVDKLSGAVPHRSPRSVRDYRESLLAVVGPSPLFEKLLTYVEALEDCPRHLGLHSGGMLLTRRPLAAYTPVQVSANGVKVAQFSKDDVERLGLIKFDVLGLRMLAAISESVELVAQHIGVQLDLESLPLDDAAVYDMICAGKVIGTFQIESQGQLHLLAQNQPREFVDLVSEVALFRPGPLQGGVVNPYIRRRKGLDPVTYEHPLLAKVLKDTYGVILFQEQVIEVAHAFAGMDLDEADRFRSLMSRFRSPTEMESMRERFVQGAMAKGVGLKVANSVFDKVAAYVGYGFCKSHAASFAKTVYLSCWLKLYYPAAYMAAIMQHRPGMYDLITLEQEAKRMGVPVLLPDINRSCVRYSLEVTANNLLAIRKPLSVVAEVSVEDGAAIVLARQNGMFDSVEDLCRRVHLHRDKMDSLAMSGALDGLAGNSRRALWETGVYARVIGPKTRHRLELFTEPILAHDDIPVMQELTSFERLSWDCRTHKSARYHPMILMRRSLTDLEVRPIVMCYNLPTRPGPKPSMLIAGAVILRQMPPTARGVMFVTLEDESAFIQCIVLPETQEKYPALFRSPGLIVRGTLEVIGAWRGLVVREAWQLEGVIGGYSGYPSAYGGTDTWHIATEESKASAVEYTRGIQQEVRELRDEIVGKIQVDPVRR